MTLVRIKKSEKEIIARELADMNVGVTFYTIEQNEEMLQADVDCNNLASMWYIGRVIGNAVLAKNLQDDWYK